MCKQMIFTNLNLKGPKQTRRVVELCQELLADQDDGFGYAIVDQTNKVVGQRTNDIKTFDYESGIVSNELKYPWSDQSKNRINYKNNNIGTRSLTSIASGPALFHGRVSTNTKGLMNVHPLNFEDSGDFLIHNGVVSNTGPSYTQVTGNDTEHLLHYMVRGNGIQDLSENLTGYYAFGMLRVQEGGVKLIVARDHIATLFCSWIPKLETFLFDTTQDLIVDFCTELKVTHEVIELMENDLYLEFKGNDLLLMQEFKSRGFTSIESAWSEKSLGHKIDDYDGNVSRETTYDYEVNERGLIQSEQDLVDYYDTQVEYGMYIEYKKTQIDVHEFRKMNPEDKLECEIYTMSGDSLIDLFIDARRAKQRGA